MENLLGGVRERFQRVASVRTRRATQKVEIAALGRLKDMLEIHSSIAALEAWSGRAPGGAPLGQFRVSDEQLKPFPRYVDFDCIGILQQRHLAAHPGLWRHVP